MKLLEKVVFRSITCIAQKINLHYATLISIRCNLLSSRSKQKMYREIEEIYI